MVSDALNLQYIRDLIELNSSDETFIWLKTTSVDGNQLQPNDAVLLALQGRHDSMLSEQYG